MSQINNIHTNAESELHRRADISINIYILFSLTTIADLLSPSDHLLYMYNYSCLFPYQTLFAMNKLPTFTLSFSPSTSLSYSHSLFLFLSFSLILALSLSPFFVSSLACSLYLDHSLFLSLYISLICLSVILSLYFLFGLSPLFFVSLI